MTEAADIEELFDFYSPEVLAEICRERDWTFESEITILIDVARNGKKDSDRLSAIRQLRDLRDQALTLSGHLTHESSKATLQAPDGRSLELRSEASRLAIKARETTARLVAGQATKFLPLEEAVDGQEQAGSVANPNLSRVPAGHLGGVSRRAARPADGDAGPVRPAE